MPRCAATRRASSASCAAQPSTLKHFKKTPVTSYPRFLRSIAATEESTPPERPTKTFSFRAMRKIVYRGPIFSNFPNTRFTKPCIGNALEYVRERGDEFGKLVADLPLPESSTLTGRHFGNVCSALGINLEGFQGVPREPDGTWHADKTAR